MLLSLPLPLPAGAFTNVKWSSEDTCISQVRALNAIGLVVRVGRTYFDIDTPADLDRLVALDVDRMEQWLDGITNT